MSALAAPPIPRAGRKGLTGEPQDVAFVTVPASSARTRCESSLCGSTDTIPPMQANGNHAGGFVDTSVPDVTALSGVTWYVAQVKWMEEKGFVQDLARKGIPHYLPLVRRLSLRRGDKRPIWGEVPLLKSYAFFAGNAETRYEAVLTHRTLAIIEDVRQDRLVGEMRSLQLSIVANPKLALYTKNPVGEKCRFITGPYKDCEGFCESMRENQREIKVVIRLEMLGASVPVTTDIANIEIID